MDPMNLGLVFTGCVSTIAHYEALRQLNVLKVRYQRTRPTQDMSKENVYQIARTEAQ
jgi:ribosomal protein S13